MKNYFSIVSLVLYLSANCFAQSAVFDLDPMLTVKCDNYNYHRKEYLGKTITSATIDNELKKEQEWQIENGTIKGGDIPQLMDSILLPKNKTKPEYLLTKKYKKWIDSLFYSLEGRDFFCWTVPYHISNYGVNNEKKVFVSAPFFNGQCYNELMLTHKERVKTAIKEEVFKVLHSYSSFKSSDIKFVGISYLYYVKDFSDPTQTEKTEFVGIVLSVNNIKKFLDGFITEEEFFKTMDIYAKSKDSSLLVKMAL